MVGMTVGFRETNRHPLVVLYEGRNAVGFLSIFCTNQPVGIGLVDSWTSPRGYDRRKIGTGYVRTPKGVRWQGNKNKLFVRN